MSVFFLDVRQGCYKLFTVMAIVLSVGLLLYPVISNWLYNRYHSSVFLSWTNQPEMEAEYEDELERCRNYNNMVYLRQRTVMSQEADLSSIYESCLKTENDIMVYLEIPSLSALLPVFHGTSSKTLEKGIGHVMESSLPIGGTGTHAVLTGHTGMSGAQMFSNLTELQIGDRFMIHTPYGARLVYEVDQVSVVLPNEVERLYVESEQDYVTLVTCTPFGINTHRLLVRGIRCPDDDFTAEERTNTPSMLHQSTWEKQYEKAVLTGCFLFAGIIGGKKLVDFKRKKRFINKNNN